MSRSRCSATRARYAQGLILCDTRAEADTPQAVEGRKKMQALVREKGQAGVADEMLPKLLGETTRAEPAGNSRTSTGARAVELGRIDFRRAERAHDARRLDIAPVVHSLPGANHRRRGRHGDASRAQREACSSGSPGSELAVIPQAGHLSSIEQPHVFNQTVARFLAHRV